MGIKGITKTKCTSIQENVIIPNLIEKNDNSIDSTSAAADVAELKPAAPDDEDDPKDDPDEETDDETDEELSPLRAFLTASSIDGWRAKTTSVTISF